MTETGVNLQNIAVILCRPKLSENIGAAARAAANMGLGRLIVVEPYRLEREIMLNAATRVGQPLIENITVCGSLTQAIADFNLVAGTTARLGSNRGPFVTPRRFAQKLINLSQENRTALVFGPERTGLTTSELRLCQAVVRIPTAANESSSLNLAQAVLVLSYELLLARTDEPALAQLKLAPEPELQAMYGHLTRAMLAIKFLPDENTGHWLMSFKRIFNRSGLTPGECNFLRGICRQIEWALQNTDKLGIGEEAKSIE